MAWHERQLAMLREIGVPTWLPVAAERPAGAAVELAPRADPADPPAADLHADKPTGPLPSSSRITQPVDIPAAADAAPPIDAIRVGALDWVELRAAVAACQACRLGQTRRQTVFDVGDPRSHWMIVGEAPGEQEDLRGEPFVGAAGQLLDRMLASLGLTRAEAAQGVTPERQVYIANTLKCRPPGNRNPDPSELARCEPFLIRQIELLQPKVILAMGRFAVQALLRSDEAIGRLRGRVHRYQGVPLVVTYHPAYLLRNPADKAKAWDDLCLAAATMASLPSAHG
jgi:uracil-DNA glycosylase